MADHNAYIETLRDLMQCVQAARDGASSGSMFAMQCDTVLDRAAQLLPGVIVARSVMR